MEEELLKAMMFQKFVNNDDRMHVGYKIRVGLHTSNLLFNRDFVRLMDEIRATAKSFNN